jgi:hypothetical protein
VLAKTIFNSSNNSALVFDRIAQRIYMKKKRRNKSNKKYKKKEKTKRTVSTIGTVPKKKKSEKKIQLILTAYSF